MNDLEPFSVYTCDGCGHDVILEVPKGYDVDMSDTTCDDCSAGWDEAVEVVADEQMGDVVREATRRRVLPTVLAVLMLAAVITMFVLPWFVGMLYLAGLL